MTDHVANDAPDPSPAAGALAGAKPTWELHFARDAVEPHDGGLRFLDTVALEDAPGFVVPRCFEVRWDDAKYPAVVTLQVRMRERGGAAPVVRVILDPRLDRSEALTKIDGGRAWYGDAPYEHIGLIPQLPVPRLLRDSLALAAMPRERPLVSEIGRHEDEIRAVAPVRRAPRISIHERALMRSIYREARADPELATKYEVRERVFKELHTAFPDRWPLRDGRTPDYDRLRSFFAGLDDEEAGGNRA